MKLDKLGELLKSKRALFDELAQSNGLAKRHCKIWREHFNESWTLEEENILNCL